MKLSEVQSNVKKMVEELFVGGDEFRDLGQGTTFTEIFKNPSPREIRSIEKFQESDIGGIRFGYCYGNGDLYAWDGIVGHAEIIQYLNLALMRLSYSRGVIETSLKDYTRIIPRIKGGQEQFIARLEAALPQLKKIVDEKGKILWEK